VEDGHGWDQHQAPDTGALPGNPTGLAGWPVVKGRVELYLFHTRLAQKLPGGGAM